MAGGAINRALPSDPDHPDEHVSATAVPLNDGARAIPARGTIAAGPARRGRACCICSRAPTLPICCSVARRHGGSEYAVRSRAGQRRLDGLFRRGARLRARALALTGGALGVDRRVGRGRLVHRTAAQQPGARFYGIVAPFDTPAFSPAEADVRRGPRDRHRARWWRWCRPLTACRVTVAVSWAASRRRDERRLAGPCRCAGRALRGGAGGRSRRRLRPSWSSAPACCGTAISACSGPMLV